MIPEDVLTHIFSFLDESSLCAALEVCREWNKYASREPLWKALALEQWRSISTDGHLLPVLQRKRPVDSLWRSIVLHYPKRICRLQKTTKFICNMVVRQISGKPIEAFPVTLFVERRFNLIHLETFIVPDAPVLYLEPEKESDRSGFEGFIVYLTNRSRAGLALDGNRRIVLMPPCDYTRVQIGYEGASLLGIVQDAYHLVSE